MPEAMQPVERRLPEGRKPCAQLTALVRPRAQAVSARRQRAIAVRAAPTGSLGVKVDTSDSLNPSPASPGLVSGNRELRLGRLAVIQRCRRR